MPKGGGSASKGSGGSSHSGGSKGSSSQSHSGGSKGSSGTKMTTEDAARIQKTGAKDVSGPTHKTGFDIRAQRAKDINQL